MHDPTRIHGEMRQVIALFEKAFTTKGMLVDGRDVAGYEPGRGLDRAVRHEIRKGQ